MADTTGQTEAPAAGPSLSEHTLDESDGNVEKQARERESSDEQKDSGESIGEYDIIEEILDLGANVQKHKKPRMGVEGARCGGIKCSTGIDANVAQYLNYESNIYLCNQCVSSNLTDEHEVVDVESEQSDRVRLADMFVGGMRNERTRESEFDVEDIRIYGHVNVRHDLDDELCEITGLCRTKDKKWAAIDHGNSCIKIYSSVTTKLLRYIRFGSRPCDATEINVKRHQLDSEQKAKTATSESEPEMQHLLAVTVPQLKEIWFIDCSDTPAIKTKTIHVDYECEAIHSAKDKIFAILREDSVINVYDRQRACAILIMTTAGDRLKEIWNGSLHPHLSYMYIYDIVFNEGLAYFTETDKIYSVNLDDLKTIDSLALIGANLRGICTDDCNNVYVCDARKWTIYKIAQDLREYEPRSLDIKLKYCPDKICFSDGKLFIGQSRLGKNHSVTVVQIT